jgi:hypothetical protein
MSLLCIPGSTQLIFLVKLEMSPRLVISFHTAILWLLFLAARDRCDGCLWQLRRESGFTSRFKVAFTYQLASYQVIAVTPRQRTATESTLEACYVIHSVTASHNHFRSWNVLKTKRADAISTVQSRGKVWPRYPSQEQRQDLEGVATGFRLFITVKPQHTWDSLSCRESGQPSRSKSSPR